MYQAVAESIRQGWGVVRNNPQIFFTVFVGTFIVGSFIFVSQLFVSIAVETQERFDRHRVSSMQDAFAAFALADIDNAGQLTNAIREIARNNETIAEFRVIRVINGRNIVFASLNDSEEGLVDDAGVGGAALQFASTNPSQSFTIAEERGGERVFRTVRALAREDGEGILGWVVTVSSLSQFDQLTQSSVRMGYLVLAAVLILILLLLVRHARIIDYAALYRRLREVDAMKDDFVGMASHELRSPLSAIRGYAEILQENAPLDGKNKEALERIIVSSNQLDDLVSDILDVSRLEQGRMKFDMVEADPNAVARDVVKMFGPVAREKNLSLTLETAEAGVIKVDTDRLRQALVNVVGNAIKYTHEGDVRVVMYTERNRVYIRTSDTGVGLSGEEQKKLFQKFYRVKSKETAEVRGTGLGLWITKQLIEQMGGEIVLESIKGVGSHFVISFPQAPSPAVPESGAS